MFWGILKLWSAFKITNLNVAGGYLGTHHQAKKNFVSQGTLYTIDQSCSARLNGRADLFRELRRKPICALMLDKEAYVQGICEGVEHHMWSSDSHPASRGIHTLLSSKPIPRCTAVKAESGGLLTEECEVKPTGPVTLSCCTRLTHELMSWISGV